MLFFLCYCIDLFIKILHAPKGFDQRKCGFGADSGYAWDIIRCIAGKSHDINHHAGFNPICFPDAFFINGLILHWIPDNRFLCYKLHEIFITCYHDHWKPVFFSHMREGSNQIISLKTGHFDYNKIEPFSYFLYIRNLNRQIFRHGWPVRFIFFINFMPECRPFWIEKHPDIFRRTIFNKL